MIKGIVNPAVDQVLSIYCNVYKESTAAGDGEDVDKDIYWKEYVINFFTTIAK